MEQTSNYQLSQWDAEDRILREDFNADNVKTEAALAELATAQSELQAALVNCGNCRIESKTYTGTGTYGSSNKTTVTFDATPLIVFVGGFRGSYMCLFPGHTYAKLVFASAEYDNRVSWNGNSVSWYSSQSAGNQFNASETTYYVIALFASN